MTRAHDRGAPAACEDGHKADSIFPRYLIVIVDEELLAQAAGAVAAYMEDRDGPFRR